MTSSSARKWTNIGAMSGLNRASAGCFTRMTGSGRRFAHVFGERTMATLGRLMSLLSPFEVV
ncbi:IS1 family transposase, partial [Klebsiella pneumoniae]